MIHIIETNLSLNNENIIQDHQSRLIKYPSWEDYINLIQSRKYESVNGTMYGCILPRNVKVSNFIYDDFHLSCDVINALNMKTVKFAYVVQENIEF